MTALAIRAKAKVDIRFDHDDVGDWVITPANHAEMVDALRPSGG